MSDEEGRRREPGRPKRTRTFNLPHLKPSKVRRKNSIDEIDLTVTPEVPNKIISPSIYVVNPGEYYECRIVVANISQFDPRFSYETNGRQCMAISCVAIVFQFTKNIISKILTDQNGKKRPEIHWTSEDLDSNITLGDHLFSVSISNLKKGGKPIPHFLEFGEVYEYCEINEKLYNFYNIYKSNDIIDVSDMILYDLQKDDCQFEALVADLTVFSNRGVRAAIFVCNGYSFSIFF